jgi:hypothetical protein
MKITYKIQPPMMFRNRTAFEFHMFMSNKTIDSYLNTWNPIFPDYINLELLKYLLSIGSCIACRVYCYNGFIDGILIADDLGMSIRHITKIERSSKFKIMNRFRKTGQDILIKVNLNVWKE